MKFRAELHDTLLLTQVLTAYQHLAKRIVIHFSPTDVRFILTPHFCETDGELSFFIAHHSSLFDNYKVESKNLSHILIVCEIAPLLKALKTGEQYDTKIVKLSKKDNRGYLTFELTSRQLVAQSLTVDDMEPHLTERRMNERTLSLIQDVPITVLPHSELERLAEPSLELPSIKLHMPNLKSLATIADKLQSVNATVDLQLSNAGTMRVSAKDATIDVKAYFSDLSMNQSSTSLIPLSQQRVNVKVRAKKLSHVLHCRVLTLQTAILCVVEGKCLIVYGKLLEKRGTITYFVPLVIDEGL